MGTSLEPVGSRGAEPEEHGGASWSHQGMGNTSEDIVFEANSINPRFGGQKTPWKRPPPLGSSLAEVYTVWC